MAHPFIPSPHVVKVELCYTTWTEQTENVFHVKHGTSDPDTASLVLLCEFFKGWWEGGLKGYSHEHHSLRLIRATILTTQTSPGVEYSTGLPIAGTNTAGKELPGNVCLGYKWTTGLRGRSYRGRSYIGGLTTASIEGNTVIDPDLAVLTGVMGDLIDSMEAGYTLGVNSEFQNGSWLTEAVFTPITGVTPILTPNSQRRRLSGRGR